MLHIFLHFALACIVLYIQVVAVKFAEHQKSLDTIAEFSCLYDEISIEFWSEFWIILVSSTYLVENLQMANRFFRNSTDQNIFRKSSWIHLIYHSALMCLISDIKIVLKSIFHEKLMIVISKVVQLTSQLRDWLRGWLGGRLGPRNKPPCMLECRMFSKQSS